MKNTTLIFLLYCLISYGSKACDVCGCAINTSSTEVVPGVFQNFLGIRSNIRHFESQHFGLLGGSFQSKEWFHTSVLFGRYSPHRRIQLIGFLPYNAVFKHEENEWYSAEGLGDARFRANLLLVDHKDTAVDQLLSIFIGNTIKAPTGRYDFKDSEQQVFRRNMLPGTGTWDYTVSTDVIYRRRNIGGILSAAYSIRGRNALNYDFGNVFGGQTSIFLRKQGKGITFLFEAGIMYTYLQSDYDLRFNEEQIYTSGDMLSPLVKVTSVAEKWSFFAMANHAAYQNLGQGRVKQHFQMDIGATYFLPTNDKRKLK